MFAFYLVMSVKWIQSGRKYIAGQMSYKPWLTPGEYLNKNVGWHLQIAGVLLIVICISIITGILLEELANQETFLTDIACLPSPLLLITGINFYMLRERILRLEPKSLNENEKSGQDNV